MGVCGWFQVINTSQLAYTYELTSTCSPKHRDWQNVILQNSLQLSQEWSSTCAVISTNLDNIPRDWQNLFHDYILIWIVGKRQVLGVLQIWIKKIATTNFCMECVNHTDDRDSSCDYTHHISHFVDIFSLAQVDLIRLNLDPETFHLCGSLVIALFVDIPKNQLTPQLGKPVGQQTPQTTAWNINTSLQRLYNNN